jgi:hypothetical protein
MLHAVLVASVAFALFLPLPATLLAQDPDATPTYRLTQSYVRELAAQNSMLFRMPVKIKGRTASVHGIESDCEMHLAGSVGGGMKIGFPGQVVVEPPNLCRNDPPSTLGTSWGNVFDSHVMNKDCTAVGFPRLYAEHLENGKPPANPPHMVEIHPALSLECGGTTIPFASFLKIHPGMSAIQDASAEQCLSRFKMWVQRRTVASKPEYQFYEERPSKCGNFVVVDAVVDPRYVRAVNGGHSAIAQVWVGEAGPFPLKLYSYASTPEDAAIAAIGSSGNEEPESTLKLHGMLTVDYFAVLKTARTPAGSWRALSAWTPVKFPLALVVFGTAVE